MDKNHKRLVCKFIETADRSTLIYIRKQISGRLDKCASGKMRRVNIAGLDEIAPSLHRPKTALLHLINADWSGLFLRFDSVAKEHYVYIHYDPKSPVANYRIDSTTAISIKDCFYVGCGVGGRAYSFKRSVMHSEKLRELVSLGYDKSDFVGIFSDGLTERQARELESKLILYFGIRAAMTAKDTKAGVKALSGKPHALFNNQYEPMPDEYMEIALNGIKINELAKRRKAEEAAQ